MEHEKTLHYRTYEHWRENSVIPKEIAERLEALLLSAYAPYSNYPVSSIVVMESGEMIVGTNQENGAFPSGLCAERVAVLAAKAAHPNEAIQTVYIMTGNQSASLQLHADHADKCFMKQN